ncbi:M20 peptidase aminoacylase family protein [Neobacillus novalis]|uniref:M20 peptidase aminoacylase family protein n=1 Tax=Neobacillus novalis TaxID=220687 RepID=A0AA95MPU7_9BACI|nr:M20 peptidase aminoacylase family protein [Neobacillus novalis]WHY87380.1 M20 peptidase aminoacylase family protein [Neobacillus novalis]
MQTELAELKSELFRIFNHLHTNPEISWKEYNTTDYLKGLIENLDLSITSFDDCTGLVTEIGSGEACVGLRTDIDALWQEVDGTFQANHSCGHDAHMTIVFGTLLLLKKMNYQPPGRLKFIFQPAEEKGTGALKLIEKGVVDDINYLYGVHLRPKEEVPFGKASSGIINGAAKFITGEINGTDAHGARPHQGQNSIEVGASIVNELSKIHLNPMVPYSVKMTSFHAGGDSSNIIPGRATFALDLRAQSNDVMNQLSERVEKIMESVSSLYGVEIALKVNAGVAAAQISAEAQAIMQDVITETLGQENHVMPYKSSGGEDFHFYTLKRPTIKATMLGLGCDLVPGLHHPKMTFNHDALLTGIEILAKTIIKTFNTLEKGVSPKSY